MSTELEMRDRLQDDLCQVGPQKRAANVIKRAVTGSLSMHLSNRALYLLIIIRSSLDMEFEIQQTYNTRSFDILREAG